MATMFEREDFPDISFWPDWSVVKKIGVGSFGEVYEISNRITADNAALKVIPIPRKGSGSLKETAQEQLDAAMDEIHIHSELRNATNIVAYEDSFIDSSTAPNSYTAYLRMELVKPLSEYWGGKKKIQQITQMGIDIAGGLSACESHHFLYLDMKPHNVFVSDTGTYKLSDFGCAADMHGTRRLTRKGTYIYTAPEVINADYVTEVDASADVYALGMVLYEMLNDGYLPFQDRNASYRDLKNRKLAMDVRLSGLPFDIPAHADMYLSLALLKACSYERDKRYRTAGEFQTALQLIQNGCKDIDKIL